MVSLSCVTTAASSLASPQAPSPVPTGAEHTRLLVTADGCAASLPAPALPLPGMHDWIALVKLQCPLLGRLSLITHHKVAA